MSNYFLCSSTCKKSLCEMDRVGIDWYKFPWKVIRRERNMILHTPSNFSLRVFPEPQRSADCVLPNWALRPELISIFEKPQ